MINFNEERKKYETLAVSVADSEDVISTSGDEDMGEWDPASFSLRRPTNESGYQL